MSNQQEDVNRGFVSRHSAYWSKMECIRHELQGIQISFTVNELCDRLGLEERYISRRLYDLKGNKAIKDAALRLNLNRN